MLRLLALSPERNPSVAPFRTRFPVETAAEQLYSPQLGGCLGQVYSHSRLKSFENCRKQFHFRYVLKVPEETEGIEAFVGKRVHEVLERLYLFVREGKLPSLPRVLHRYEEMWEETYDAARVRVVRTGTPTSFYRQLGIRCLETYYRRNYPFDGDQTLGIEERVRFDLGGDEQDADYRMQGIIDRIALARDGAIEIHDYKTGNYVPSQKAIDEERQLALYQIGLAERYGADRVFRLVWHYVARGIVRRSTRSAQQLDELRASTRGVIDRIRSESEYPPTKIKLCDWCSYKSICPAWGGQASEEIPRSAPRASPFDRGSRNDHRELSGPQPGSARAAPRQLDLL
jgi:putative RecB family exonuclease